MAMRWTWALGLVAATALSAIAGAQTPPAPLPPSLDYADPGNWVCRPDRRRAHAAREYLVREGIDAVQETGLATRPVDLPA